jgi:hypothetical protein
MVRGALGEVENRFSSPVLCLLAQADLIKLLSVVLAESRRCASGGVPVPPVIVPGGQPYWHIWAVPNVKHLWEVTMSSNVTSLPVGILILPIVLAGVCFMPGCSDQTHETGTMVTKPPGAAAAEKRSMEGMKAIMKDLAKQKKR